MSGNVPYFRVADNLPHEDALGAAPFVSKGAAFDFLWMHHANDWRSPDPAH
jgi:hypothetical protein